MKISQFVIAAAAALGSTYGVAATGPLDLSSGSTGFSNSPVSGGFSDVYTFSLVGPSVANSSITSVVNGSQDIDFTSVVIVGPSGVFAFTQLLTDPVEVWSLPTATLAAGSYTLTLSGTNSAAGASYGGNFAVTPAPVPEPETLALMLAGMGVVGFIARLRRTRSV